MERKPRVLFVSKSNSCRSQMAEGFLHSLGKGRFHAHSAGVAKAGELHSGAVQAMQEVGIDISRHDFKNVADLGSPGFDLVVTLCDEARDYLSSSSPLWMGVPAHIHWPIADPSVTEGGEEQERAACGEARDRIQDHVRALLDHGYLEALSGQREHMERLADLLDDGIIAHDGVRHIYLFNRAAEQITGRSRKEVLGMDCHRAFPPDGLCGLQCPFQRGPAGSGQRRKDRVAFTTAGGVEKQLKITSTPIDLAGGNPGVLVILRDMTEVSELRWKVEKRKSFHGMVGISPAYQEVLETIRSVSTSDYAVLITGESGTGKELVASAIHKESRRRGGPFVPINCGALPENILESELFGHVRGAFTGAIRDKQGRFELAHGGTLFLDEVGELSQSFQVKLLRVLQEKTFERVGGEKPIAVDVRIISATNRDLRTLVRKGEFREDLFYRLCVVPITLPPLRERQEDIPFLVERILEDIRQEAGKQIHAVADEAMEVLLRYDWPGNIRELINALQFASVRCGGPEILPRLLPPEVRRPTSTTPMETDKVTAIEPEPPPGMKSARAGSGRRGARLTQKSVKTALARARGNRIEAAKILGVSRATLYRFFKEHPVS